MSKKKIKTKKEDIVKYWFARIDESNLSVDAAEAHERCWRCGLKNSLERCHIIPDSLGGEDTPSNLVLLCHRCHLDNPNINAPEIMWDWIYAYKVPFYDTFWYIVGLREYEFIYNKNFKDELRDLGIIKEENIEKIIGEFLNEIIKETSCHFGHPYMNSATIAGTLRVLLKKLALKYGKTIEPKKPCTSEKLFFKYVW